MPNYNQASDKKHYIDGIHCDVSNCSYNDQNCNCSADKITVGPTNAVKPDDTECATFIQK